MRTTKTILLAMTVAVGGSVSVAYADEKLDDRLEERVSTRLSKDARFKDGAIRVDVEEGVATLKGRVASDAERVRAEKMVRAQGVKRVENQLEVDVDRAKERVEERAEAAKDRIDSQAEKAKERVEAQADRSKDRLDDKAAGVRMDAERRATKDRSLDRDGDGYVDRDIRVDRDGRYVDRDGKVIVTDERYTERPVTVERVPADRPATTGKTEPGAELSDTWITTKVKAQFVGEDALKGSDISVDTNRDGVVTLTGTVPNEAARARAIAIAKTTKGVQKVVDAMKLAIDNK
jgi:osmotically-inducible protein OsmY